MHDVVVDGYTNIPSSHGVLMLQRALDGGR